MRRSLLRGSQQLLASSQSTHQTSLVQLWAGQNFVRSFAGQIGDHPSSLVMTICQIPNRLTLHLVYIQMHLCQLRRPPRLQHQSHHPPRPLQPNHLPKRRRSSIFQCLISSATSGQVCCTCAHVHEHAACLGSVCAASTCVTCPPWCRWRCLRASS